MSNTTAKPKAHTLREIRRVCGLGPLCNDDLPAFWVDTDQARDPHRSVRQCITMKLDDSETDTTRILVYGHGGSGKSTELCKLVQELEGGFFSVTFSIRDEMNLTAVNAEDILLVLTERLLRAAQEEKLKVNESELKPVHDYFAEVTKTVKENRESASSVEAEASVGSSILAPLLKLMAKFKSEIKLSVHNEHTTVAVLRKRPADLLVQINSVIETVREALRPSNRRLLIIVEDLDKLDIASAHDVFIRKANLLSDVRSNIIYTIPIFTFHSPDANILRSKFDAEVGLPMIKIKDWKGNRAAGFEIVKEIVWRRIKRDLIAEDALDLLVEKTGGVLQHVFEVINTAASMTNARMPLALEHIKYGLQKKRNEFWSEISLPVTGIDGVKSETELFDRLAEYANKQLKGEKNLPQVNSINQVLLRSCALIEYNGERWYGVHPLVIDNLKELGRI